MNNTGGHFAILAAAGVAGVLLSVLTAVGRLTEQPDQASVVVTLPQRPSVPAPRPATKPQPATAAIPGDRASLVRALQSELLRVGCYDGDVSGVWNARSRAAMKAFTERVNATLPVATPPTRSCWPWCRVIGDEPAAPGMARSRRPRRPLQPRQASPNPCPNPGSSRHPCS